MGGDYFVGFGFVVGVVGWDGCGGRGGMVWGMGWIDEGCNNFVCVVVGGIVVRGVIGGQGCRKE